ncbi:MAG TPA: DUF2127 domain-containing protein [Solirubrobacteraceae bacterium]|nr:DUF2127 domain-containing protein [Solirubrobacteraceae bacterium]
MAGPEASTPPGTVRPRRFLPRFHYELLVCGLRGHELVGTDAAEIGIEDAAVVRPGPDGARWHRCLRCDSWVVLPPPAQPTRARPPARDELILPPRGRALRDKVVLRIIAVDRALHFVVLGAIAVAILVFAASRASLQGTAYRVLADIQSGLGQSTADSGHGIFHELRRLFAIQQGTLTKVAIAVAVYALIEGVEAVGLWWQKRWAEYLTLVATALLLPLEIYELAHTLSPLKLITFAINLAVVIYLLVAKRLFGLRGGAAAERAERERDTGWPAVDRATPA